MHAPDGAAIWNMDMHTRERAADVDMHTHERAADVDMHNTREREADVRCDCPRLDPII